jgi:hypothetical protein
MHRENLTNDGRNDVLLEHFKNVLEEHRLDVDVASWFVINKRLRSISKRRHRFIVFTGIAAAVLLLLFVVNKPNEEVVKPTKAFYKVPETLECQNGTDHNIRSISDLKNRSISAVKTRETLKDTVVEENVFITAVAAQDSAKQNEEPLSTIIGNTSNSTKRSEPTSPATQSPIVAQPTHSNEWKVYYSMGASQVFQNQTIIQSQLGSNLAPGQEIQTDPNHGDVSISNVKFALPISFGMLVQKKMNNVLSIETGLVYSFLSTTYQFKSNPLYRGELNLHYLGIPLNIVVNTITLPPRFKVYTGIGVMGEKGLQFESSKFRSDDDFLLESKGRIDGFQWSVGVSLGVSYQILKHWDLYLETSGSHYFENDQPISIRTERQTQLGMRSGIKYNF